MGSVSASVEGALAKFDATAGVWAGDVLRSLICRSIGYQKSVQAKQERRSVKDHNCKTYLILEF